MVSAQNTDRLGKFSSSDESISHIGAGLYDYVEAFARLIESYSPPPTIGIYGQYGKGTAFFMDLLERRLKGSSVPHLLSTVFYSPEKYPADMGWVPFFQNVIQGVENKLSGREQIRLINRQNWKYYYQRVRMRFLPFLLLLLAIEFVIIYLLINQQIPLNLFFLLSLLTSGAAVSVISLVRNTTNVIRNIVETETSKQAKSKSVLLKTAQPAPGFTDKILATKIIAALSQVLEGRKIVVFIDLTSYPDRAPGILEGVQILSSTNVFIVVMAMDPEIVATVIEKQQEMAGGYKISSDWKYLDDIVSLSFNVPEPSAGELYFYLASFRPLEESSATPTETDAISEPFSLSAISDRISEPTDGELSLAMDEIEILSEFSRDFVSNPRRIKRLINIYLLVRTLVTRSHLGQVHGHGWLKKPHHLVGWLILCEQWPYLAQVMLALLDLNWARVRSQPELLSKLSMAPVLELYEISQLYLTRCGDEALQKLDLSHDRLPSLIEAHLADLTLADVQRLRLFTSSLTPTPIAKVQLS
jgi:hypothetical protein